MTMKFQIACSRRAFLRSVSATSAAMMLSPIATLATEELDPRVKKIVTETIGVDTHNHIDVPFAAAEVPGPNVDLAGEIKRSGLSAICMTFAVDRPELRELGQGYERFKNGLSSMDKILVQNGLRRSMNMADISTARKNGQPAIIQSVEGGHFLEGHLKRLEEAYDRGLRHLGLLHDNDANVPLGDIYTNPVRWGGLTSFGADVIRKCNELGILIDLAHANGETVNAALKLATHPVIISHTGLDSQLGANPKMAAMMRARLISKDQAKTVAETGGVIGVWTHLADTPMEYAQNIRALVDVIGIDHVCIGTDTKMTPSYRAPGDRNAGANQGSERVGERTMLAWKDQKFGFYYTVVDAMLKTGFTAEEIAKVGGGNFCRVFDKATA
jgi:membrane dipeptidase